MSPCCGSHLVSSLASSSGGRSGGRNARRIALYQSRFITQCVVGRFRHDGWVSPTAFTSTSQISSAGGWVTVPPGDVVQRGGDVCDLPCGFAGGSVEFPASQF